MEPAPSKVIYTILSHVAKVEEKYMTKAVTKGPDGSPISERVCLGWFAIMEGSSEYIHLGFEVPELKSGDAVEITIRKRNA